MRRFVGWIAIVAVLVACHDSPFVPVDMLALNGRYDLTLTRSLTSANPNVTCPSLELDLTGPNRWTPASTCGRFTGGVVSYAAPSSTTLVLVLDAADSVTRNQGIYSMVLSDAAQRGGEIRSRWSSNFSCPESSAQSCAPESGIAYWKPR